MTLGDDVVQVEGATQRQQQHEHHREPGVDRAHDEVGREDRRVPAGKLGDAEIETDDAVDGDHQRRRQRREERVRDAVSGPLKSGTTPA